jgi:protein SCO1/2
MTTKVRLLLVCVLLGVGCKKAPEPAHGATAPEVYGTLPEFRFTDQAGRQFGTADLKGSVWVGNTFFTSCHSICPALMAAVKRLSTSLEGVPVRYVSFTVDPDNDTPEVLAAYAKKTGADGERWRLLTADYKDIRTLIVDGFKTALGTPPVGAAPSIDIEHSGKLFLVDGQGRLRGYFPSDGPGLEALAAAAKACLP